MQAVVFQYQQFAEPVFTETPTVPDISGWLPTMPSSLRAVLQPSSSAGSTMVFTLVGDTENIAWYRPASQPVTRVTFQLGGLVGPVLVIPNPPVTGDEIEDRIHLGTKEAYGISWQPEFGGW